MIVLYIFIAMSGCVWDETSERIWIPKVWHTHVSGGDFHRAPQILIEKNNTSPLCKLRTDRSSDLQKIGLIYATKNESTHTPNRDMDPVYNEIRIIIRFWHKCGLDHCCISRSNYDKIISLFFFLTTNMELEQYRVK